LMHPQTRSGLHLNATPRCEEKRLTTITTSETEAGLMSAERSAAPPQW
jgi:hypothetical protein